MSAGWVAGTVRARAMSRRRVGRSGARALATAPGLDGAVATLTRSPYGQHVHAGRVADRSAARSPRARLLEAADVVAETRLLRGPVGRAVLEEARAWPADIVVIGRAGRWHSGEPYVGAQTRHVLEFAAVPVVVVPRRSGRPA